MNSENNLYVLELNPDPISEDALGAKMDFDDLGPSSYDTSLEQLRSFLGQKGAFTGWLKQNNQTYEGIAVITVTDTSIIEELEEQKFVKPEPLPGYPHFGFVTPLNNFTIHPPAIVEDFSPGGTA